MSISGANPDPHADMISSYLKQEENESKKVPESSGGFNPKPPAIAGLKGMTPKIWQKELLLMAQNFCNEFKKYSDRVIEEIKKDRQQS